MSLEVELAVQSRLDNLELVQMVLEETLARLAVDDKVSYEVGMAVREAVANAIQHGNGGESHKKVRLTLEVTGEKLVIRVCDEGEGFDPARLPDPLTGGNLLQTSGRGLLFMKEFMDEIDYTFQTNGGTEVRLTKRYRGAAVGSTEEESL